MAVLKVQLNHPGNQKPFKIGKDYLQINNQIIRVWNNDPQHYRKFIRNDGEYLSSLDGKPQNDKLLFWGEWEGNSVFTPINNIQNYPNGIHEPFHSVQIRGCENTDPYIYGDDFKYATCKQTGQLCELDKFSLILFGSTYPSLNAFFLDTVFVVKSHDTAVDVCNTNAVRYSLIYRQETLEQLENDYLGPNPSQSKRLYLGLAWTENKEYFSFVPCKQDDGVGFERLKINLGDTFLNLSSNPTGKSFLKGTNKTPQDIWKKLVELAFQQGYHLGIRFNEPQINDTIFNGFKNVKSLTIAKCNKRAVGNSDISISHRVC